MKAGKPLQRTVGLARGAALVSKTQLQRTTGMPQRARQRPATGRKHPDTSTNIPQASRDTVAARSQGRCEIQAPGPCTGAATDWHHRQRRREGDHSPANGLHACRRCHRLAHDRPELARSFGWIVSAHANPAEAPLMLRGLRWVLLGDGYTDTEAPA